MYDVIKETVYPKVDFVQGIPLDLDQDSFINPSARNLVILDDLMSTAAKDSQVNELFTEGSHHRNLSVIVINQNLYFNKDPTQRRNCHYLVMFNNPVDQQQVMTLARQMFPGNSQHLMRHFQAATSVPYGYLVIDLKPFTPEHLHMRTDVFDEISQQKLIRGGPEKSEAFINSTKRSEETEETTNSPIKEDMPSCDDCGLLFETIHDLQRHIKTWCPENTAKRRMDDDIAPPPKRRAREDTHNHKDEKMAFNDMMVDAKDIIRTKWLAMFKDSVNEGMTDTDVREKTETAMKGKELNVLVKDYAKFLHILFLLRHGSIHEQVVQEVEDLSQTGNPRQKAIKMAIAKNKRLIENTIDDKNDDETDDGDDSSESDEEDLGSDYQIQRILSKDVRNGRKMCLVQWKNWPALFNSWIKEADVEKYLDKSL